MTKKEFIEKYSKISETFEDDFKSQYNSIIKVIIRKILRKYNEFNNKEMIYSGALTDFEIDCFIEELEGNFNDFISTKFVQELLSKRLMNSGKKY